MKKLLSVSLVLAMLLVMLAGCNLAEELSKGKQVTSGDLTMTVPALYLDMKDAVKNDALAFVYGIGDTAVLGVKESRAEVLAALPDVDTAMEYAEIYVKANKVDADVTEKDGIITFTYKASSGGHEFTYLCGVFANDTNFWVVQTYCYTEEFTKNEADFWDILKSVKV